MAWYSLLPPELATVEAWIMRLFMLLAVLTIGPWAALVIFDVALYVWRMATYELPYIGGRARGRRRPRAPSLTERPNGRRRTFSLRGLRTQFNDSGSWPLPEDIPNAMIETNVVHPPSNENGLRSRGKPAFVSEPKHQE